MPHISNEQGMWEAVVRRALEDVSAKNIACPRGFVSPQDFDEAVRFLTDERGGWAERRQQICDMAGLEASLIRREALRILRKRQGDAERQGAQ